MPPAGVFEMEGVTELNRNEKTLTLEVSQNLPQVLQTAAHYAVEDIETHSVSLEEIFLAYYGMENGGNNA
jgi:hypothetical protein